VPSDSWYAKGAARPGELHHLAFKSDQDVCRRGNRFLPGALRQERVG
jgi:hypothetical protein